MRNLNNRNLIGIAVALGISALATSAGADTSPQCQTSPPWCPHFTVTELHSANGANTAGSLAASAMMGAQGFSSIAPPPNWDNVTTGITGICTTQTINLYGGSLWPSTCNPDGMAHALHIYSNNSWVMLKFAASDQATALDYVVNSLEGHGSPAVVPLFGQADHWVAVVQIYATWSATQNHYTINNVKWFDGGPVGFSDGGPFGGNTYSNGLQGLIGSSWVGNYYLVINNINKNCNPCTTDPFYNQYVLLYEPPVDAPPPSIHANFGRAPGVVPVGTMNAQVAPGLVWKALSANGIDADPQIWNAISGGVPGAAFEVHGVFPSGSPWEYVLVPIFDRVGSSTVKGFVQLAADDGSYEGFNIPSTPVQFIPVSKEAARQIADGALTRGESLIGGTLTWDPRIKTELARSLVNPWYEFEIRSAGQKVGSVRVSLNGGAVARDK